MPILALINFFPAGHARKSLWRGYCF